MIVYCKNKKCIWCKADSIDAWERPIEGGYICGRPGSVLHINEEGGCALFVPKKNESRQTVYFRDEHRHFIACPWPCNFMKAYSGRNFCPFCGRDLR